MAFNSSNLTVPSILGAPRFRGSSHLKSMPCFSLLCIVFKVRRCPMTGFLRPVLVQRRSYYTKFRDVCQPPFFIFLHFPDVVEVKKAQIPDIALLCRFQRFFRHISSRLPMLRCCSFQPPHHRNRHQTGDHAGRWQRIGQAARNWHVQNPQLERGQQAAQRGGQQPGGDESRRAHAALVPLFCVPAMASPSPGSRAYWR